LSVVPQESILFEGTIRDNILYGMKKDKLNRRGAEILSANREYKPILVVRSKRTTPDSKLKAY
jgi:hypothetical protein